jgi:uncharacterized protein involved in exopolysaccharide biosynthesis
MNRTTADLEAQHSQSMVLDLMSQAWRARWIMLAIAIFLGLASFAYAALTPRQYDASVMISPVLEETTSGRLGGIGALASQYGGLASLAGISLPGRGRKDEALAVLQSELLTETYIKNNDLLPVLYRKDWDAANRRWTSPRPRTLWEANRYFKRIREVNEDRKSGLVIMTIRWTDPVTAAHWANDLVKMTNSYLRQKAMIESERNISYLNEQAAKTNVVEVQKAIYSLLQDEINREMVARGREEYALKVIDPAFVPEKSSSYGRGVLSVLGFAVGIFGSMLVLLGKNVLRT